MDLEYIPIFPDESDKQEIQQRVNVHQVIHLICMQFINEKISDLVWDFEEMEIIDNDIESFKELMTYVGHTGLLVICRACCVGEQVNFSDNLI